MRQCHIVIYNGLLVQCLSESLKEFYYERHGHIPFLEFDVLVNLKIMLIFMTAVEYFICTISQIPSNEKQKLVLLYILFAIYSNLYCLFLVNQCIYKFLAYLVFFSPMQADREDLFLKFRRWWKGVNIFEKAYIFLPIHEK